MANNRMYIRCLKCGALKMLAKYYPTNGWYMECLPAQPKKYHLNAINMYEQLERCQDDAKTGSRAALDAWFDEHRHDDFSMWGPMHFTIEFEMDEDGDAAARGSETENQRKRLTTGPVISPQNLTDTLAQIARTSTEKFDGIALPPDKGEMP